MHRTEDVDLELAPALLDVDVLQGAVGRAGTELVDSLARVLEAASTVQAVKAASQRPPGSLGEGEQRAAAALAELLDRAQGDGQVRAGITVADVCLLVSTAPADQPGPVRSRWLHLVTGGLLTTPAART